MAREILECCTRSVARWVTPTREVMYVLRNRNGQLYVVFVDTQYDDPVANRWWYPTGQRSFGIEQSYGNVEGKRLKRIDSGLFSIEGFSGLRVTLAQMGQTKAEHSEKIPIPPPRTRKRGPIHWQHNRWYRWGPGGREDVIEYPDLYKIAMA